MVNWISLHRDELLLGGAVAFVLLPIIVGRLLGHVPGHALVRLGLPMAASTLVLALGIRSLKRSSNPYVRDVVSVLMPVTVVGVGIWLFLRKDVPVDSPWTSKEVRLLGLIVAVLGAGWGFIVLGKILGIL